MYGHLSKFAQLLLKVGAAVAAPAAGNIVLYGKTGKIAAYKTEDDVERVIAANDDTLKSAVAGGTADALTAAFDPALVLADMMRIFVRATLANATTTPTLAVDGGSALVITKNGGSALAAGDIFGAGHELTLVYVAAGPRWELLNPASSSGGGDFASLTGDPEDNAALVAWGDDLLADSGNKFTRNNPAYANMSCILHFNGPNNSTTITDNSASARVWTCYGNAMLKTADAVLGSAALNVPSGSNSSIGANIDSSFDVGSGNWAMAFKLKRIGSPETSARIFQTRDGDVSSGITIYHSPDGTITVNFNGGALVNQTMVFGTGSAVHDFIIQVYEGICYGFMDGSLKFQVACGSAITYNSGGKVIIGGNNTGTSRSMNCVIDEFLFCKGDVFLIPNPDYVVSTTEAADS